MVDFPVLDPLIDVVASGSYTIETIANVLSVPINEQIGLLDIPRNQDQAVLYVDYTKGAENYLDVQVYFEDLNIPGEFFQESAKENLTTMEQVPLFHRLSATRKLAIPFPLVKTYKTIRVVAGLDSAQAATTKVKIWLNIGRLQTEPIPQVMLAERPLGEGWELPE